MTSEENVHRFGVGLEGIHCSDRMNEKYCSRGKSNVFLATDSAENFSGDNSHHSDTVSVHLSDQFFLQNFVYLVVDNRFVCLQVRCHRSLSHRVRIRHHLFETIKPVRRQHTSSASCFSFRCIIFDEFRLMSYFIYHMFRNTDFFRL